MASKPDKKINDDMEMLDFSDQVFKIYTEATTVRVHKVYLSEVISTPFLYKDLLNFLRTVPSDDLVEFYLANDGGNAQTMHQIINAIGDCKASVQMVVDAPCYSAGAVLATCGDNLIMKPGTFLMFHNYSMGMMGKGGELASRIIAEDRYLSSLMRRILKNFLTNAELTALEKDQDVYVHEDDPDLMKRFKRRWPKLYPK
jgi:ATP-dependent protease ClpP protease subunit